MKSDIVIVLGSGIKEDGTLPESSIRNVSKAVSILQSGDSNYIAFCGKWAWNYKYTPPLTEAEAMRDLAISMGVSPNKIYIEKESVTTVSNLCMAKQKILIPNNLKKITLIVINDIFKKRNEYNLKMVLGPNYEYEIVSSQLPNSIPPITQELENQKLKDCISFYQGITPGDDEAIYKLSQEDLYHNYINKQL